MAGFSVRTRGSIYNTKLKAGSPTPPPGTAIFGSASRILKGGHNQHSCERSPNIKYKTGSFPCLIQTGESSILYLRGALLWHDLARFSFTSPHFDRNLPKTLRNRLEPARNRMEPAANPLVLAAGTGRNRPKTFRNRLEPARNRPEPAPNPLVLAVRNRRNRPEPSKNT